MTEQVTKPVIFLAFANDRAHGLGYLRNLPEEARRLQAALTSAEQANLCEVVLRQGVTIDQVLNIFQDKRYRNRIAIFHYGGHANGYQLLLETATGDTALADAGGLAAFLGQQNGLELVFLNGCSTQQQTQGLLDAGVATVISTSQAIDDRVATDFAARFYQGLASGATIQSAFNEAAAAIKMVTGSETRHLYLAPDTETLPAGNERWPWALYLRDGAELVARWNLPAAVNDPLFGLPPLPEMDLPAKPFRDLSWFRHADAPIFFGRGHQIRELYTVVTDAKAAPIVLFYGQSGVGKSSLLDAGLLPRLEQVHRVVYLRRDQEQGLLGTLAGALPPPNLPQIGGGTVTSPAGSQLPPQVGEGWGGVWRAVEQEANQPLTLILDQVEEHFTRPNAALPDELEQFLAALVALFANRGQRPQGKLILSFRKEWLAEIEKRLSECELPFSKIFLERLDEAGVLEAVRGVAATPALQQHYGLTLEEGLADEIAHDLLKDREAAVAPMLQILLTRLWEEATLRNRANPRFDHTLYDQLRRGGLKLQEFLDRQLARLKEQQAEVVASGLALDLLTFHTTDLGTAEQRDFAALQKEYHHRAPILADLVRSFQNLYLLVDPAADQADAVPRSRLAHDTLAPLVRARFDESDAPGQRARRILESRAVEWDGIDDPPNPAPLDRQDLGVVEAGETGMRTWREAEKKLIEASRKEKERRQRIERWLWISGIAAVILITAFAGFAWWQWDIAQTEAANARARELAFHVQAVLENPESDPSASLALLLATEAVSVTLAQNGEVVPEARRALVQAIDDAPGFVRRFDVHSARVRSVAFHPDGQHILTASDDGTAKIFSFGSDATPILLDNDPTVAVLSAVFSPDGTQVLTTRDDGTVRLWSTSGEQLSLLSGHQGTVNAAAFTANGAYVVTVGEDEMIRVWEAAIGTLVASFPGRQGPIWDVAVHPNKEESIVATAGHDGTVRLWEIPDGEEIYSMNRHISMARAVSFSPKGDLLFSGGEDYWAYRYGYPSGLRPRGMMYTYHGGWRHSDHVSDLAVSLDGAYLATVGPARKVGIFSIDGETMTLLYEFAGHTAAIDSVAFDPTDNYIATAGADHSVRLWSLLRRPSLLFEGHKNFVLSASFRPDSTQIATRDASGKLIIWDINQKIGLRTTVANGPSTVNYSPDGRWLLSGYSQTLYDATSGNKECGPFIGVTNSAFRPTEQLIATGGLEGKVRLWDYNCKPAGDFFAESVIWHVDFSPDGEEIITAGADGVARIWNRTTHQKLRSLEGHQNRAIFSARFDLSGTRIVTAGDDRTARIWERSDGSQSCILEGSQGHTDRVWHAAFSPDGKHVVTASDDGTAKIWDAESCQVVAILSNHTSWVRYAAYSPDGKWIVTTSGDQTARIWNAETFKEELVLTDHERNETPIEYLMDLARSLIQRRPPTFTDMEKSRYFISD